MSRTSRKVNLDLDNYEYFLDVTLTEYNNKTTGKISKSVLDKERKDDYRGNTVQVVSHITDTIKENIEFVAVVPVDGKDGPADVYAIELGGTEGDVESMPFIEALRQLSLTVGYIKARKFILGHAQKIIGDYCIFTGSPLNLNAH